MDMLVDAAGTCKSASAGQHSAVGAVSECKHHFEKDCSTRNYVHHFVSGGSFDSSLRLRLSKVSSGCIARYRSEVQLYTCCAAAYMTPPAVLQLVSAAAAVPAVAFFPDTIWCPCVWCLEVRRAICVCC
jgi:hypothetical protein